MRETLIRLAKRCTVMLSGEILQSAFHFALSLALMHSLSPTDYGIFAIVLLMGGLALTYMRSLVGMPATLLIPPHVGTRRTLPHEVTLGSAALGYSTLIGLIVGLILHFWLQADALAGGLFVGLWSLRSFMRSAMFAKGLQGLASTSDLAFTVSGGVLAALLLTQLSASDPLEGVFGVLALANAIAIATALLLQRQRPRLSYRRRRMRSYAGMARQIAWSTAGTTMGNIQAQGQVLLIAAIAGPAAYAPVAAMLVFFAPLRLVAAALANMVQPELTALTARDEGGRAALLTRRWTLATAALGIGYGLVMAGVIPMLDTPIFIGQPRAVIAVLAWCISMAPLLYLMPKILLEVQRRFRVIAAISAASAVVGMALVALLLMTTQPAYSLAGSLASEILVLVGCWIAVERRRRKTAGGSKPASAEI